MPGASLSKKGCQRTPLSVTVLASSFQGLTAITLRDMSQGLVCQRVVQWGIMFPESPIPLN